ncbi:MAG: hypothetical protein ACI9DC_002181 [Gammaproteobacteria bacterium]|jgi:uncharacterized protein YunC (DUF1805 family)
MIQVLDSITKPGKGDLEGIATVCGSHGGVYATYLAARARALAIVLHDAGVGKDNAGIACIAYCQNLGMAAATVDFMSAKVGNGEDMLERGRLSFTNNVAKALGVTPGMSAKDAMPLLEQAPNWHADPPAYEEGQCEVELNKGKETILCLDSASMAAPEHNRRILAIGSHGGLLGGDPAAALRTDARAAMYNDAGVGIDGAGTTRLPALDERGIAAVTVSASSALIGDGRSTLMDGEISAVNECARQSGAVMGMMAREWAKLLLSNGS